MRNLDGCTVYSNVYNFSPNDKLNNTNSVNNDKQQPRALCNHGV